MTRAGNCEGEGCEQHQERVGGRVYPVEQGPKCSRARVGWWGGRLGCGEGKMWQEGRARNKGRQVLGTIEKATIRAYERACIDLYTSKITQHSAQSVSQTPQL
jgi:hypothetical protein